jgi:hypothetical protein
MLAEALLLEQLHAHDVSDTSIIKVATSTQLFNF